MQAKDKPKRIWAPKALRQRGCSSCSSKAISVCNFESQTFRGCRQPFCTAHGFFPPQTVFDQLSLGKEEIVSSAEEERKGIARSIEANVHLFRACNGCANSSLKVAHLRAMMRFILLVGILVGLLLVAGKKNYAAPAEGTNIHESFELTRSHNIAWFRFFSPACIRVYEFGSSAGSEFFRLTCFCSNGLEGGDFKIENGSITKKKPCQLASCAPDGQSHVKATNQCSRKPPNLLRPGQSYAVSGANGIKCPYGTAYFPQQGVCRKSCQGISKAYFSHEPYRACQNCPLYTVSTSTSYFCSFDYSQAKDRRYRIATTKALHCPRVRASTPKLAPPSSAYQPGIIDELGYFHCPEVNRESIPQAERVCSWFEMTIQFEISCSSPCQPCLERWDFSLKKCVPGEKHCSEFGFDLVSSGECWTRSLKRMRPPAPIYKCE